MSLQEPSAEAASAAAEADAWVVPVKCIKDEKRDLPFFQSSEAYARIVSYILALNGAVLNRKVSDPLPDSEVSYLFLLFLFLLVWGSMSATRGSRELTRYPPVFRLLFVFYMFRLHTSQPAYQQNPNASGNTR